MSQVPDELVVKIKAYVSHPTADIMRPFVDRYNSLKHVRTDFPNYMKCPSYMNFWDKAFSSPGPITESYYLPE
jgi:hypothetical protein